MAERAKPKKKSAAKGRIPSRGRVATLPKQSKRKKRGGIGDNSGEVPDEVKLRHINALRAKRKAIAKAQEEVDQLKGVYRAARKLAKKEGLILDAFDIMVKLDESDHGAVITDYAHAGDYLRLVESPLAQMELFQNLEAPKPVVDVAMQGLNAGKNAEPADVNPHPPGSADFVLWAENHARGLAETTAGFTKQ
jgi:hypothetical protein